MKNHNGGEINVSPQQCVLVRDLTAPETCVDVYLCVLVFEYGGALFDR